MRLGTISTALGVYGDSAAGPPGGIFQGCLAPLGMPVYFWIAIGTSLSALVAGLILKARLSDEQDWEELVDNSAPSRIGSTEARQKTDAAPTAKAPLNSYLSLKAYGEEMKTESPAPPFRSSRDGDLRRSSRLERTVPLVILGTNRRGETFQERTSAVAVNLHGCRYSSRHDYAPEGWVTLQVTGTDGAALRPVRARVRSVISAQTSHELCQVGVELETPGNVWGIPAPPEDWQRTSTTGISSPRATSGAAPVLDPSTPPPTFLERQLSHAERRAEVTVFPNPHVAPATEAEASAVKDLPADKTERAVVSAEELLRALQGRIEQAADHAVQTSLSVQLDAVVKSALGKIEEGWKANVRQTEEFSAARLAEAQSLWEKELVVYRKRAEEVASRLETLTTNAHQSLAEVQKFVERFTGEVVPQFHARITEAFSNANAEFEGRAAQVSERLLADLTHAAQNAALDSRAQLDQSIAEVRSSLAAAGPISQEGLESLLHSSQEETRSGVEARLKELFAGFEQQADLARQRSHELSRQLECLALEIRQDRLRHEQDLSEVRSLLAGADTTVPQGQMDTLASAVKEETFSHLESRLAELTSHIEQQQAHGRQRTDEIAQQLESLASETRQSRSQHEQGLAELRSLLAYANNAVPQEQFDSRLNSSREGILSHLEWRLGEVSGHFDQLLGQARNRADELSRQLEKLSSETHDLLSETRNLAERASREIQPQNLAAVEQAVSNAAKEFENAAARVSDRQLVRLMELKQSVSQEVSLELDARASEARALLQKAANSTMEDFRYRVETQIDLILADARERLTSSLASLEADSRASVEARHRVLEADVARAAEQSTMEFRSGIKAFLYSCLVAAVSAVDQHAQTTLAGLSTDPASMAHALDATAAGSSQQPENPPPSAKAASFSE